MEVIIDIPDRIYKMLRAFCESNSLEIGEYSYDCVYDRLMLDLYGDLNDKVKERVPEEPAPVLPEPESMPESVTEPVPEPEPTAVVTEPREPEVEAAIKAEGSPAKEKKVKRRTVLK